MVLLDSREGSVALPAPPPPVPRLPELLALGTIAFGVALAGTYLLREG